jgi:hypothetical protein
LAAQNDIEDDKVRFFLFYHLHGLVRGYGLKDKIPFQFQKQPQYLTDAGLVID